MSVTLVQYPGLTRRATLSPPCAKVHMALRFKGVDYGIVNVNRPGEIKRYNPRGRVPVLLFDGAAVPDSTDILTDLDRRFPDRPLLPGDPLERARVKIYEDWADEVLYFYGMYLRFCTADGFERMKRHVISRMPAPVRWVVPWIARRETRRRTNAQGVGLKGEAVAHRELAECYRALSTLLEGRDFVVGERLTRADLALAATADQHRLEILTPAIAAEINALPPLVAWLDRVHEQAPSAA